MADIPDDGRVSRRTLLLGGAGAAVILGGAAAGIDYESSRQPRLRRLLFGCGSTPSIPPSGYTISTGTFSSAAMHAEMPWDFAIPTRFVTDPGLPSQQHPLPLIIVLPGADGQAEQMVGGVGLPGWASAAKLDVAFASPGNVGSSYYHPRTDGTDVFGFVTDEFVPMIERRFGVGGSKANRAVYGWSMGGFGALLVAQQRPDLVCAAVGSSPAVFPTYEAAVTGHPGTFDSAADWARWGLWDHVAEMGEVPVRIDCGEGDPFAPTARQLLDRIPGAVGHIGGGCHDTGFWRRNATTQLQFLAAHLPMSTG